MNTKLTIKTAFIILLYLSFYTNVFAQPGRQMQGFQEEKIKYFNEKLNLNDKESKEFWPVYNDLQNRITKNIDDEKNLLQYYNLNEQAMSKDEVEESLDKYLKLQSERIELKQAYHDKFIEIIGERKTMKMYAIERQFRLHVINKFRHGKGSGPGRR